MTGYNIFLSSGSLLTTINVKTIDVQAHTSLILIGQGIPDYGTPIAQDLVWMLENFSKTTPPVHPLIGQEWYDLANGRMNFWTGTEWRYYEFSESSFSTRFDMAPASQNIDFTLNQSVAVFTPANHGKIYCPSHVIMLPRGAFTATNPATINLSVSTAADVLMSTQIAIIPSTKFVKLAMNSLISKITGGASLSLNITSPASGGQLNYDVYAYGAVF